MSNPSLPQRSPARIIARVLLGLVVLLGLIRLAEFAAYVVVRAPLSTEAYHLESKMVHMAWRVQHGVRLYPPWRDFPHVANFFGPVDFAVVGGIGRALGSSLEGLFLVGRGVTILAGIASALLVGHWTALRWGRPIGLVATVLMVGSGPMFGFGLMTRPDALADFLGLAGFILATMKGRAGPIAGAILLGLAILTKQTTAVYLAAAALALVIEGRRTAGLAVGLGTAAGIAALVAGVTFGVEPEFGPGLLGESRTPWDLPAYGAILHRMAFVCPDLLLGTILGVVFWGFGPRREPRRATLAAVVGVACVVAAAKRGADLNYLFPLRAVAAMAVAEAAGRLRDAPPWKALGLAVAQAAFLAALIPSTLHAEYQMSSSIANRQMLATPAGRAYKAEMAGIAAEFRDPAQRLLTDSGRLDIEQGGRAVFGDPWLFRMLVETGRIRPDRLVQAIEAEEFDAIVTTKPIDDPSYATYEFGMPMPMIEAARRHYVAERKAFGLFYYRPLRSAGDVPLPLAR